jgi:hypothetical protein
MARSLPESLTPFTPKNGPTEVPANQRTRSIFAAE